MHPPGTGQRQLPDTAFCRLLAEFFTWLTDDATAAAAVAGGWPFADVIADCRPDSALSSAAVCDGNAGFASVANVLASAWTLLGAVGREPRPFVATSTLPRFWTEVLSWLASVQYVGVLALRQGISHPLPDRFPYGKRLGKDRPASPPERRRGTRSAADRAARKRRVPVVRRRR